MVIDVATAPQAPAEVPVEPSHVWRMVLMVVAVQLVLIAIGMVFFTAMGYADATAGTCGGG